MLGYKHILLATDLSEETDTIAAAAINIINHSKADLSIVHVLEHTPVVYGGGEFSIPLDMNLEEHLGENARKALANIANRFKIPVENQFISHGSVKREIVDLAEKIKADLIILGSHGHSGLAILLGSTANAVLHAAKCDVLAVRVKG
ncbi:MAG: universal stress protein [Gammaproteobacteria bacterium]|nr:universal stress protein [Gammaproteobacteria bacterium]